MSSSPIHAICYKGYATVLQQDPEAQLWHGRILGISDVITFEAQTDGAAEQEFRESVDAYLSFCAALGRLPSQPPADSGDFA
ncbi:MAG: type II toxin-antitoxin system HicB family antitoxin [Elainella sp.]